MRCILYSFTYKDCTLRSIFARQEFWPGMNNLSGFVIIVCFWIIWEKGLVLQTLIHTTASHPSFLTDPKGLLTLQPKVLIVLRHTKTIIHILGELKTSLYGVHQTTVDNSVHSRRGAAFASFAIYCCLHRAIGPWTLLLYSDTSSATPNITWAVQATSRSITCDTLACLSAYLGLSHPTW